MSSKTLYLGKVSGKDQNGKTKTWYINKNKFHSESFESVKHGATTDRDLLKEHCLSLVKVYSSKGYDNIEYSDLRWSIVTFTTDVDYENDSNKMENNNVNHPKHYNQYPKETIDIMIDTFGVNKVIDWCVITAFKYRQRMGLKGNLQEDFDKEQWYLNKAEELKRLGLNPNPFWGEVNKEAPIGNGSRECMTSVNINPTKDPLYDKHCEEEKQAYTLSSDIKDYVVCDLGYKLLFTGTFEECGDYYRRVFYGDVSKAYFLDRQLYIDGAIERNILPPKLDTQETRTDKGCLINPDVIVNSVTGEEYRWKGSENKTNVSKYDKPSFIGSDYLRWGEQAYAFYEVEYNKEFKKIEFLDKKTSMVTHFISEVVLDFELLKPKSDGNK